MIEAAALLSGIVQKWDDLVIILIMLLVNAGLDFFQEHRALNALAALKAGLAKSVIALRDGAFTTILARELVPGDVVKLRIGDIVPADVKLLDGDYLSVDRSALTGESFPVSKKADELAYANTIVKQGEMSAVVVNTGARTAFAKVVSLVAKASLKERSHFQRMVIQIDNFLILITVALVALIVMVAIFRHESLLEIARFSLVLTVAAIPVALPAVLSVTMAVGALNLARRQAIVSRLSAIEELAGVDVFCSDKTGTLTQNRMAVTEPLLMEGFDARELFLIAALASKRENQDPLELPLFDYLEQQFPKLDLSLSGVGTPVTRSPRHRPGRAVFSHPVPRLHSLSRERGLSCKHHGALCAAWRDDAGAGDTEPLDGAPGHRLRPHPDRAPAGALEHVRADHACNRAWGDGRHRLLSALLPAAGMGILPGGDKDLPVSELIVAGHSTLYITRARGWSWQKPWPAPIFVRRALFHRDRRHGCRGAGLVDGTDRLGAGTLDLGLRAGLVRY
jgi:magnesium-transporting ATPase (P-type)